jgi:hypothetical protein
MFDGASQGDIFEDYSRCISCAVAFRFPVHFPVSIAEVEMKCVVSIAALFLLIASASAQELVLTAQNFVISPGPDTVYTVGTGMVSLPSEGANVHWDYSKITLGVMVPLEIEAAANPAFNAAFCVSKNLFDVIAAGRGMYYDEYFSLNAASYGAIGISISKQEYGIGDLTFFPTDSIVVPAQDHHNEDVRTIVRFPWRAGSVNSSSFTRDLRFVLSVTPFGLKYAAGLKRSRILQRDTVVGFGTLVIGDGTGVAAPMPALLVRRTVAQIDSFFLNDAPASSTLLTAFQIEQGALTTSGRYLFLTENRKTPALSFVFGDDTFTQLDEVLVAKSVMDRVTAIDAVPQPGYAAVLFPNPTSSGAFTVFAPAGSRAVVIRNSLGQLVDRAEMQGATRSFRLPASAPAGVYFYHCEDAQGRVNGGGSFVYAR